MFCTIFIMMNTNNFKNIKQSEESTKVLSKRNEQEVHVLPPNLLQQLGINLKNIQNNSECCKIRDSENDSNKLNGLQLQSKVSTNKNSINETKREMAVVDTIKLIDESSLSCPASFPDNKGQNINKSFMKPSKIGTKLAATSENNLEENNDDLDLTTIGLFKNNQDFSIFSDKSTNISVENIDVASKTSTCTSTIESRSKINIISQEVFSAEKLNNLKLHAEKNNLIPFKINNPLKNVFKNTASDSIYSTSDCFRKYKYEYCETKDNNNIEDIGTNSNCIQNDKLITTVNADKIMISFSENKIETINHSSICINRTDEFPSISTLTNTENPGTKKLEENEIIMISEGTNNYIENNNNFSENKGSVYMCEEKIYDNHEISTNLGQEFKCINIADNKVKEIANYLSQYFLPAKANVSPKRFVIKPKICIQGVEKPGGTIKTESKSLRTYQNKKTKNIKISCNNILFNNISNKVNIENVDINDNVNDAYLHCVVEQLCICKDFGKLQFYDDEYEYQHIHFSDTSGLQISSTSLFEIYNADCIKICGKINNDTENNQYFNSNFCQDEPLEKICYTKYLSFENDTDNNVISLLDDIENQMKNINDPSTKSLDLSDSFCTNEDKNRKDINDFTMKDVPITNTKSTTPVLNIEVEVDGLAKDTLCGQILELSSVKKNVSSANHNSTFQKHKRSLEGEILWENFDENWASIMKCKKKKIFIKCAVCSEELRCEDDWEQHLSNEHCYISWKMGQNIDLKDKILLENLTRRLNEDGLLKCTFCGKEKKYLKKFIKHIKICLRKVKSAPYLRKEVQDWNNGTNSIVKCGVCSKEIFTAFWMDHIATEHNYKAWKSTEPPLDFNDQQELRRHLQEIIKQIGELVCARCGVIRKYVKAFMQHTKTCEGNKVVCDYDDSTNDNLNNTSAASEVLDETLNALKYTGVVKCGVCYEKVNGEEWLHHIHKEHNYLARIDGNTPLNKTDEEAVHSHLHQIRMITGYLTCAKCGLKRKFIKSFLQHIKSCDGTSSSMNNSHLIEQTTINKTLDVSNSDESDLNLASYVQCGVCGLEVEETQWLDHIHNKHNYIAWIEGRPPIDVHNEEEVWHYLNNLTKEIGGLVCFKCGLNRKYVKAYLQHIKTCDGVMEESVTCAETSNVDNIEETLFNCTGPIKCGVCLEEMVGEEWIDHIQNKHNYLSWIEGNKPLDLDNNDTICDYLKRISKRIGGLICAKCGLVRKFAKAYLQHVNKCDGSLEQNNALFNVEASLKEAESEFMHTGAVKCGVCKEEVNGEQWIDHIHKQHDYLARIEGKAPLDVNDEKEVRKHLNKLKKCVEELICNKCGQARKFVKVYMRHVMNCDGDEKNDNKSNFEKDEESEFIHTGTVTCGVCREEVDGEQWINHIHKQHGYLARIEGKLQIDVDNEYEVQKHLYSLKKYVEELICNKCGQSRKFVRSYLCHINKCEGIEVQEDMEMQEEDVYSDSSNINNICLVEDSNVIQRGTVKCGVCQAEMDGTVWLKHIQLEHNYLARVEGKPQLNINDAEQVRLHLYSISKQIDGLVCSKCEVRRKYVKAFLQHIKNCDGKTYTASESNETLVTSDQVDEEIQLKFDGNVICGVCKSEVDGDTWVEHIQKEHNYLAHVDGNTPLNLKDQKQVQRYLHAISKHNGGLYCAKCGLMRLYAKSFLRHLNSCDSSMVPTDAMDETNNALDLDNANNTPETTVDMNEFVCTGIVKCGVCLADVEGEEWISHIQNEHNYLAWVDGRPPLNLDNIEHVHRHLYSLSKVINGLTCKSCGIKRKYVKSFLDHVGTCDNTISAGVLNEDNLLECAVCLENIPPQDWRSHAMNFHYNIAWATGMKPIDLRNPYMVEKYLKDYKQSNKNLVCKLCKTSRASCVGFYAHIITCGKTEEEIEFYKAYCEICHCKYLCIYKNQHLAMHREQELAKEKKQKIFKEEKLPKYKTYEDSTQSRRKAAERAKTVIEDYKTSMNKLKYKCSSCGFATDLVKEIEEHNCESHSDHHYSDSDVSHKFEAQSEEESESDVDSNISMEEAEHRADKKKRYVDLSAKVPRLLFKVNNASNYVSQGAVDFINMHYTHDVLFPYWITSERHEINAEDIPKYIPILNESCKVKIGNGEWTTYERFEAKRNKVTSLFAGGCIRCMAWVPACACADTQGGVRQDRCGSYLAVASHAGPDVPRLPAAKLAAHRSLVQLWDFADFTRLPTFVLGIVHDFGTVWAMDWCPSGVRDCLPSEDNNVSNNIRLGLLAVACSNGSAYVFVVPCPNVENGQKPQIIKIKPSAELRLCSGGERNKFQATAICWSQQKGHSVILVGYADGTAAFYNFDCDSPLLKTVKDGVTILYPFQDERPHNTCISDVGLFASCGADGGGWGAWSGASCTGAHAALRASAPRLHTALATARATFTPHWPSVIVTADEAIANHTTNELEWQGGGRRLGGQCALATCVRCGIGAAYVPPVLRVTRTHPAHKDQRRDIIGFIRMAPLAKKRSKHVNDDLSMKVEPLIYEDAVKEYGLEFKLKSHMDKGDNRVMFSELKQHFPERFPLAEVTSMSFCTSPLCHGKLAMGTHAGLIFIVDM